MRLIGLDYGDKRIGVAISDALGLMAHGLEVIEKKSPNSFKSELSRIKQIANEYNAEKIVLGFPKSMDNTCGERCNKTLAFRDALQNYFASQNQKNIIDVILWDERLSTVASGKSLSKSGFSALKQKKIIDKMSAVFILQGYLDFINLQKSKIKS